MDSQDSGDKGHHGVRGHVLVEDGTGRIRAADSVSALMMYTFLTSDSLRVGSRIKIFASAIAQGSLGLLVLLTNTAMGGVTFTVVFQIGWLISSRTFWFFDEEEEAAFIKAGKRGARTILSAWFGGLLGLFAQTNDGVKDEVASAMLLGAVIG